MNKATFYDLSSSTSIITFSEADAATFLQGQVTCDVLALSQAGSSLGALCNPKGRVISTFQLCKVDNSYLMLLPKNLCDTVIKHLTKFKFRSKVNIQDSSDQYIIFGCAADLPGEVEQTFASIVDISIAQTPSLTISIYPAKSLQLIQLNTHINIEEKIESWQQILTNACYPELCNATSELFIPQMLNLDYLNGISFKKGCYTGQEIVARMHYKGSVKRRLVCYKTTQQYQPGNDIHQLNVDSSIGTILSSHTNDNTNFYGLAVVKVDTITKSPLILNDNNKIFIQPAEYVLD